jgi:hypothetical protein
VERALIPATQAKNELVCLDESRGNGPANGGSVNRRRISRFIPIGLLIMSSSLLWHNFSRGRAPDFAVGALLGVALGMMIVGLVKQRRGDV